MKKNYLYNLLLSVVNLLFPILSFPYASRILGPEGIGKVQMASSFAQYFALIAALGIPVYGIQEIARHRHDKKKMSAAFSELFIIYFITSLIVSFCYLLIVFCFPFFKPNIKLYGYAVVLIAFGFSSIDWLYAGLEEFKIISLRSVFIKAISLMLLYVFVKTETDFTLYLLILIFSMLGNNFISLLLVRKRTDFVLHNLALRKHLRPLLYIFGTNVATSMYMVLDTVLLGFLSDEQAVGLYTAAIKLTKISLPFITSFGAIMLPQLSKYFHEKNKLETDQLLQKSFHFTAVFSIPISMGIFILSPELIRVFSGEQFYTATTSLRILAFLPVIIGFGYFFALQIMVPLGRNKEMFLSVLIGMIFGVTLNFILVPIYREEGASLANVFCELLVTSLYYYFLRKHFYFNYQWVLLIKAVATSLLFIPVVLFLQSFHLPVITELISAVVCCSILYFTVQHLIFKDYLVVMVKNQLTGKFK